MCEDNLNAYASYANYTKHCYPEQQSAILTPGGLCEGNGECGTNQMLDNWFVPTATPYNPLKHAHVHCPLLTLLSAL